MQVRPDMSTKRTVDSYMTKSPQSVAREAPLAEAMALMDEHHIRHLPVMFGDRMVGVISERDVILVNSLKDLGIPDITVEDAMTTEPYTVAPGDDLGDVVRQMAEKKIGSAVVVDDKKVVGIFTAVDACRALAELL